MTVLSTVNKMAPQAMNGVATTFYFTFRALTDFPEAIKAVIYNTVTQVSTTLIYNDLGIDGYSVSIDADGVGGSIVVNNARSADYEITIYREYDETQESNYADYNSFPADTVEDDYDKGVMIDQQLTEILSRVPTLPIVVYGIDLTLPIPEAGRPIGWNDTADGLTNYPSLLYQLKVDAAATPDYLGATDGVGVLRVNSTLTKTDGGDFVTLSVVPGAVDHDSLLNFVANEHIDHSTVSIIAGSGLSGGGTIAADRTLSVNPAAVDHDSLLNFVADEHVAHSGISVIAGNGLTGGGTIDANRTINVGAGTGITVNVDDIAVSADYSVISANDINTDVTGAELEELTDGSITSLHTHAGVGTDEKVKVDAAAVADYLGNSGANGVLRVADPITHTDGGDFVTLGIDISTLPAGTLDGADLVMIADVSDGNNHKYVTAQDIADLGGGGGGASLTKDITQAAHGFSVGDWIYHNGTGYALADASAASTAECIGIVSAVGGINDFTVQFGGYITGLAGLTAGEAHFLSETAGDITATAPTTEGAVNKPVLIADSATSGYIFNMRGIEVTGTTSWYQAFTNADLSGGVLTVTHNLGHKYAVVQIFDNNDKQIMPDDITLTGANALTVDLTSYGTITGTWRVVVLDIGANTSSVASDLSLSGQAAGDMIWFNGTNWARIPAGTSGQILISKGTSIPQWQTTPVWMAELTSTQANIGTGSSVLVNFDNEIIDNSSSYDTTNKRFSAPIAGYYQINMVITFGEVDTACNYVQAYIQSVEGGWSYYPTIQPLFTADPNYMFISASVIRYLSVGQTVRIQVLVNGGAGAQVDILSGGYSAFSGHLII